MRSRIADGLLFLGALAISIAFVWWIAQPDTQPRAVVAVYVVPQVSNWCGMLVAPNDYAHSVHPGQAVQIGAVHEVTCTGPRATYSLLEITYHDATTGRSERGYVESEAIERSRSTSASTLWLAAAFMFLYVPFMAYGNWTKERRAAGRGYDGRLEVPGAATRGERVIFWGLFGVTVAVGEGAIIRMVPAAGSAIAGAAEAFALVLVSFALAWTFCRLARIEPRPANAGVGALAAARVTGPHQGT